MNKILGTVKEIVILSLVEPLITNMMDRSTEINHAKHARDFTERMRCIVAP